MRRRGRICRPHDRRGRQLLENRGTSRAPRGLHSLAGMLASLRTAAVFGIEACPVHVEVDVSFGFPGFTMVGLPDASVRESRDRVRAAIRNSGFEFPAHRITVNLAPADVRKAGASFDLPIALGILAAQGVVERREIADCVLLGELSLDGSIHPTRGVLPIAAAAKREGVAAILLPAPNAGEAAVVSGLKVYAVSSLAEAVQALNDPAARCATPSPAPPRMLRTSGGRSRRCPRPAARAARARDCFGRRTQPAAHRAARRGQDHAGAAASGYSAAADVRRGAGGDGGALGRRAASARRRAADRPPIPRAASHHLGHRADWRRRPGAPGRSQPGASRRSVSRRDARVHPPCAGSAAAAARRRHRGHRPRGAHGGVSSAVRSGGGDEPMSVRLRDGPGSASAAALRSRWRVIAAAFRVRCAIGWI